VADDVTVFQRWIAITDSAQRKSLQADVGHSGRIQAESWTSESSSLTTGLNVMDQEADDACSLYDRKKGILSVAASSKIEMNCAEVAISLSVARKCRLTPTCTASVWSKK